VNPTKPKGKIYFVLFRLIYTNAKQRHLFMVVHFSDREMQRAWKQNFLAYEKADKTSQVRTNAHRLLLFYSIECGLKAMLMKYEAARCTDVCAKVIECGHDINKLLDTLKAGQNLKVPHKIIIKAGGSNPQRILNSGEINQMWRYGGEATHTHKQGDLVDFSDEALEKQLLKISVWIREALR
jgi:hypothetical protein